MLRNLNLIRNFIRSALPVIQLFKLKHRHVIY